MVFIPKDAAVGSAKMCLSVSENAKMSIANIVPLEKDITITDEEVIPTAKQLKWWKKMGWDANLSKEENEKRIKEYIDRCNRERQEARERNKKGLSVAKKLDYSKVNASFKAAREGMFSDKSKYGLVLFGKNAEYPMWVVVDYKTPKLTDNGSIYIDRDFDGIVGEEGEKLELTKDGGIYKRHISKQWTNPETKETIDIESILWGENKMKKGENCISFLLKVQGVSGLAVVHISEKREDAGKQWLSFNQDLKIIKAATSGVDDSLLYYGNGKSYNAPNEAESKNTRTYTLGIKGENKSYWFLDYSYLPKEEGLLAKLEYTDKNGVKKTYKNKLDHKC